MAVDPAALLNWEIPAVHQRLHPKDIILYALGVGLGQDPLNRDQLAFTYEDGLRVLPTMATVLASPGFWLMDPGTGVDWARVVHGEQTMELHTPLPTEANLTGRTRVVEVVDKGPDKGLFLAQERVVTDADTGVRLCTLQMTTICKGDGGAGNARRLGEATAVPSLSLPPAREPDVTVDMPTLPNAALLYRLSGDLNPLHADPDVAAFAGFSRPILHGLCTFGIAGHALLKAVCAYQPDRLQRMGARFTAPVYPGETIRTHIWQDGSEVKFQCFSIQRGVEVLGRGVAQLSRELPLLISRRMC